ncbi:hypothetical protein [Hyphomonas sp.]|uniref:hypothetical protein n=1 Tax=Hyphomonas sp. TaxID=87 RepID=UPI0025BE2F7B|nr:hypothetical protein [Hyphomonas sp.]MBI1401160.1 hypothetical protein [Hyphomonas sp.]
MPADTPQLDAFKSGAMVWIIDAAIADGNAIDVIAPWTKALVAHMRDPLSAPLRARISERFPSLEHFTEAATLHMTAHEGYIEDEFSVSFPLAR